jgi:NarL family two-component system response regulator LiaR
MEKMLMSNFDRIRLLIVDDHKVVRKGLKFFISTFDDIELVGEAKNGRQAVEQCAQHQPDVVLMDLVMPVMDGPTAIKQIHEQFPEIKIVALTSFDDEDLVHQAIASGAIGYLYKDVNEEELIGVIRAAYEGRSTLAPEAMQALVNQAARKGEPATLEPLTKRELEILTLVAQGMTNPQIAEQLVISPSTVNFHIHNILPKLQAGTRTEAVRIAIQNKVIEI